MVAEDRLAEGLLRDPVRVVDPRGKAGQNLGADTFDGPGIETRLGHGEPQQVKGLVAVAAERLQVAGKLVERGTEGQGDGLVCEPPLEGFRVKFTRPLVQQTRHQFRQPLLARRIGRRAAGKHEAGGDDRQGPVFHQPGFDPAGADDTLDVEGARRRHAHHRGSDQKQAERQRNSAARGIRDHDRFHVRLSPSAVSRMPVVERLISNTVRAAALT